MPGSFGSGPRRYLDLAARPCLKRAPRHGGEPPLTPGDLGHAGKGFQTAGSDFPRWEPAPRTGMNRGGHRFKPISAHLQAEERCDPAGSAMSRRGRVVRPPTATGQNSSRGTLDMTRNDVRVRPPVVDVRLVAVARVVGRMSGDVPPRVARMRRWMAQSPRRSSGRRMRRGSSSRWSRAHWGSRSCDWSR